MGLILVLPLNGPVLESYRFESSAYTQLSCSSTVQERSHSTGMEESARDLAKAHEERVAALEARLTDLSLSVASYDRTRQEDLLAIHKLKVRL